MASHPFTTEEGKGIAYGGERSTLLLCQGLVQRNHQVTLACPADSVFTRLIEDAGLAWFPLELSEEPLTKSWRTVRELVRIIQREQPDLLVVQMRQGIAQAAVASRLTGVPLLATCRSLKSPRVYRLANRVIAISEAVKRNLVEAGLRETQIDVVYNGVDINRFAPVLDTAPHKEKVGLPAAQVTVGVVARLAKEKGHAWFLRAARMVKEKAPRAHFVFVGDGEQRAALEQQARELGLEQSLTFTGYQEDVLPWMAALDIVVLPSVQREGLGRVLLEAGAMAKPSIGTPVGGMNEIISDGKTGFIVPTNDEAALSSYLLQLVEDANLRRCMGLEARDRIEEVFTLEIMVDGTEAVYRRLTEKKASRSR